MIKLLLLGGGTVEFTDLNGLVRAVANALAYRACYTESSEMERAPRNAAFSRAGLKKRDIEKFEKLVEELDLNGYSTFDEFFALITVDGQYRYASTDRLNEDRDDLLKNKERLAEFDAESIVDAAFHNNLFNQIAERLSNFAVSLSRDEGLLDWCDKAQGYLFTRTVAGK